MRTNLLKYEKKEKKSIKYMKYCDIKLSDKNINIRLKNSFFKGV